MYNIYFLPYCVFDMHCVTIKKPSFHALDASGCGGGAGPRYPLSTVEWSVYEQIIQYMLPSNKSSLQRFFTVRLIALNKNIEL